MADGTRRQVVVFSPEGEYIDAFGEASDQFKPTDIAISGNLAWVASISDHHVYVYSLDDYSLVRSFSDSGPGSDDYLYQPANLTYNDGRYIFQILGRTG
ncbi:MAG: hypothetical protein R2744_00215 [Bacteroidales bacterium]